MSGFSFYVEGRARSGTAPRGRDHRPAPRARVDFHRHSVEFVFSKGSIGNPDGYGWNAGTNAGPFAGHAYDQVRKPNRYIQHG